MAGEGGELTAYEQQRLERMMENRKRMQELGLQQMVEGMQQASLPPQKKKRSQSALPAGAGEPALPQRRSKRNEGREAPNYRAIYERSSSPSARRPRDGPLVKDGECEEAYGVEHVRALGSHQQPWEMFQDGYNSSGERLYDAENGKSCHQCRQKTLGQHTSCSRCKSGLGVLCGDCLFARYGENVEEANANRDWVCPCCRDLCNCSRHRKARKWEATGALHRSVKARGYLSVAHYLVLNKVSGIDAKRTALESGLCPPDLADKLRQDVEAAEAHAAAEPAPMAEEQRPGTASAGAEAAGSGKEQGSKQQRRGGKKRDAVPTTTTPEAAAAAGVLEASSGGSSMQPASVVAVAAELAAAGRNKKAAGQRGNATLDGVVTMPTKRRQGVCHSAAGGVGVKLP